MSLCCCNFYLEPRYIGKGHKRCVFTLIQAKVLQIFCFLSPYKVAHFPQSQTCNLASIIMKVLIKLKFESCSFRILLRKIHFQICIEHSFNHQSTQIESPCCTKKIARIMLSETKPSRLFIFYCLHVICRYMESWSPSRCVGF